MNGNQRGREVAGRQPATGGRQRDPVADLINDLMDLIVARPGAPMGKFCKGTRKSSADDRGSAASPGRASSAVRYNRYERAADCKAAVSILTPSAVAQM
jgi:hypothetical protein